MVIKTGCLLCGYFGEASVLNELIDFFFLCSLDAVSHQMIADSHMKPQHNGLIMAQLRPTPTVRPGQTTKVCCATTANRAKLGCGTKSRLTGRRWPSSTLSSSLCSLSSTPSDAVRSGTTGGTMLMGSTPEEGGLIGRMTD